MRKTKRDFVCLLVVATFTIATLVAAVEEIGHIVRECDPSDLTKLGKQCGDGETCAADRVTGKFTCVCRRDYVLETSSDTCVKRPPKQSSSSETTTEKLDDTKHSSGSSVAVGLLVPTFLIGLGVFGFCMARRYRLLPCRRNLYGNVLVTRDEDDDDPPIA